MGTRASNQIADMTGTSATHHSLGLFGGTFDPVHRGHITLAQELQQHLQLDEMRLIPCRLPPHRGTPVASEQDRLDMLQLAIAGTSLSIDERELHREGPSYSVDTLASFRKEFGENCSLVLCMGQDAFTGLNTWYRWTELLVLANIAVVDRPEHLMALPNMPLLPNALPLEIMQLLTLHQTRDRSLLKNTPAGYIYLTQLSQIPVSSSQIRRDLADGKPASAALLPSVAHLIQQRGLYRTR